MPTRLHALCPRCGGRLRSDFCRRCYSESRAASGLNDLPPDRRPPAVRRRAVRRYAARAALVLPLFD